MLEIKGLSVAVAGTNILHDVNLTIGAGETHVLFGPNGAGKSTLLMTIMGFPKYRVTRGKIIFNGKDITRLTVDERARLGIGMSFQRPPVVRGVKTRDMVAACLKEREGEEIIRQMAEQTDLTDFLDREINYGFSGGEIKRSELMQLLAQKPQLSLLDEPAVPPGASTLWQLFALSLVSAQGASVVPGLLIVAHGEHDSEGDECHAKCGKGKPCHQKGPDVGRR